LLDPDKLALEIVENLEAGLESFKAIIGSLNAKNLHGNGAHYVKWITVSLSRFKKSSMAI